MRRYMPWLGETGHRAAASDEGVRSVVLMAWAFTFGWTTSVATAQKIRLRCAFAACRLLVAGSAYRLEATTE